MNLLRLMDEASQQRSWLLMLLEALAEAIIAAREGTLIPREALKQTL